MVKSAERYITQKIEKNLSVEREKSWGCSNIRAVWTSSINLEIFQLKTITSLTKTCLKEEYRFSENKLGKKSDQIVTTYP